LNIDIRLAAIVGLFQVIACTDGKHRVDRLASVS